MGNETEGIWREGQPAARYEVIRQVLRRTLTAGKVPHGLVLLEGPLAQLFGTSRVPVRKALSLIHDEGLIARFEGRGFIVAGAEETIEPLRINLTRELLGLDDQQALVDTRSAGERVFAEMHDVLATCMIFGRFQVSELRAADFYGVSRASVRESLLRLRDMGLVEKEPYSQWLTGPLTAREIRDHFEIRVSLETTALLKAGPNLTESALLGFMARLEALAGGEVSGSGLEPIEEDLHVACPAAAGNKSMMNFLRHNQSAFIVSRIFYDLLSIPVEPVILEEHRLVYEMLLKGNHELAALCLKDHLLRAQERTLQRLKVLSVLPAPAFPMWIQRL